MIVVVGAGLIGLAIAYELAKRGAEVRVIEAHGGTIEVQSEVDRGTKFTIGLPIGEE